MISSSLREARCSARVTAGLGPPGRVSRSEDATVDATISGSWIPASSTNQTPSGTSVLAPDRRANSKARRLFPTPPTPVRVSRLRAHLDEAYAVEPEPETKALYRRLLSAGQAMPATIPHNLPESTTSFIGRRRLLTELSVALGRTRLLTLTGVGGVGKSRLALELARRSGVTTEVHDGVWLVELAGIQDPEILASTVASSLRLTLPGGPNPMVALAGQLASRKLLLIMDNCEHLLEACGDLVNEVLTRGPEINVVTTS